MKSIFHHFQRAFIEANRIIFLEAENAALSEISEKSSFGTNRQFLPNGGPKLHKIIYQGSLKEFFSDFAV